MTILYPYQQSQKGMPGASGRPGNGIADIIKISTVGLIDTYRILFTNGMHKDYDVTNGIIGSDGTNGVDGVDGKGIASHILFSTVGLVKTYRITYTDATTFDYIVMDGVDGVGTGDMVTSTYDPAGGARQVSFACTTQSTITDYTFTGSEARDSGYLVTTASNRTVNISPDLFSTGYEVSICKGTNNSNTVTLDAQTGNNINGSQTFVLTQYNEVVTLIKDGADTWKIKSHYYPISGTNTGNQTVANTSNATSHTVTLSATGGSVQLVEGANITLTTTGTGSDGIVTIASTASGTGDVVGPASATDNAIARFDATTGKLIQNSAATIADTTGDITAGKYNTVAISGSATPTLAVTGTTAVSGTNSGDNATNTTYTTLATTLSTANTWSAVQTFLAGMFGLRNVANTFTSFFTNTNTASRTYTLPDANSTLPIISQQLTITGPTASRSIAVPDANFTVARTDAANTFTGVQSMTSPAVTTSITTPSTLFDAFNTTATTLNIGGAATTLTVGGTPTTAVTHNYSTNATATATTKTLNIGTGGAAGSTTNINIGSTQGGILQINSQGIILGGTSGITATGTIELGHASDTTISRASAGRIAIEGVNVPTISSTDTLTNKTMTGATNTLTASVLKSATTEVSVSGATAPSTGQVLTATNSTTATWQTPSGGTFKGCRVKQSSAQAIGTTLVAVAFDAETFDTDTMHDNATNNSRITFTTAGYYQISGAVTTDGNAVGQVGIRLNGSTYIFLASIGNSGASLANGPTVSTIYQFSAADYIEMMGYFGSTQNTKTGENGTHLSVAKVG